MASLFQKIEKRYGGRYPVHTIRYFVNLGLGVLFVLYLLMPSGDHSFSSVFGSVVVILLLVALAVLVENISPPAEIQPSGYFADGTPYDTSSRVIAGSFWMVVCVVVGAIFGWSVPEIINESIVTYYLHDDGMVRVSQVVGGLAGGYIGHRGIVLWSGITAMVMLVVGVITVFSWVF